MFSPLNPASLQPKTASNTSADAESSAIEWEDQAEETASIQRKEKTHPFVMQAKPISTNTFIQRLPQNAIAPSGSSPSTSASTTSTPMTSTPNPLAAGNLTATPRIRPSGSMTRADFESYVRTHFQVGDIHTGTQTEQERLPLHFGNPTVSLPNWTAWDPGPASPQYASIINGIEDMIDRLAAIPALNSIVFFEQEYDRDPNTGQGIAKPSTGATYSGGSMNIFKSYSSGNTGAANGRNQPGNVAPTDQRDSDDNIKANIIHELGHGVAEAAMAAQNNNTFTLFKTAVGWIGRPPVLYDIGQATVRTAIANNTSPPVAHRIPYSRWSDEQLIEQPISEYSVRRGPSEDFPESIAAYVLDPGALQARSPRRFNFIQTHLLTWLSQMNLKMPALDADNRGDFPMPPENQRYA